ncbi:hypothetical protein F5Y18DRAFT_443852 [Xylariaceae sp. FL1019]|nr:hypothetical protein F5Y18DRAFT_443852 [Xylariaceae sp. FL1019]
MASSGSSERISFRAFPISPTGEYGLLKDKLTNSKDQIGMFIISRLFAHVTQRKRSDVNLGAMDQGHLERYTQHVINKYPEAMKDIRGLDENLRKTIYEGAVEYLTQCSTLSRHLENVIATLQGHESSSAPQTYSNDQKNAWIAYIRESTREIGLRQQAVCVKTDKLFGIDTVFNYQNFDEWETWFPEDLGDWEKWITTFRDTKAHYAAAANSLMEHLDQLHAISGHDDTD